VIDMDQHSARVGYRIANALPVTMDLVLDSGQLQLVSSSMLIGGEPGSGKSVALNLLALQAALQESTCLACPPGCGTCTRDECDCECYEHQDCHPGDEPGSGGAVA
jgi:hypothetical protein